MVYTVHMNSNFASPVNDQMGLPLDLNQYLIKHPAATFFMRAEGQSMCAAGILDGDLLIVDRSLTPKNNSIVIAIINGELMVKPLKAIRGQDFQVWGVVCYAIHDLCAS